jgi:orotate phosphoribosyltransferase
MTDINEAAPPGARGALLQQIKDKAVVHGKVTLS